MIELVLDRADKGKKKEMIIAILKARFDLKILDDEARYDIEDQMKEMELVVFYKYFWKVS